MYSKNLSEKLNELESKISFIELFCKYDVSFNNDDVFIDQIGTTINEIIDVFVQINGAIKKANTLNRIMEAYFEVSNSISDILVEMIQVFENKIVSKIIFENLINEFKKYKLKLIDIINNSINDIANVFYEIRTIEKKDFFIVFFSSDKGVNSDSLKSVFLYEIENYKIDSIVIDSINEEKIRNILMVGDYGSNIILSKKEVKIDIPNLKNRAVSTKEYGLLNENIKRIDLDYYLLSKNSNISIISNNCWGGYLYNKCGIKYSSPLVWTFIPVSDFIKLINNLKYYFNCKLQFLKDTKIAYPIALLDDIKIYFPHFKTDEEAEIKWNKRLERLNYDNILVQANIENYDDAVKFNEVNIENKIGFTPEDYNLSSCVYLDKWENNKQDYEKYKNFSQYCHLRSWEYIDISKIIL